MATTISRWGNSLGIRLPKEALERADLHEGDILSIESTEHGLLLRPADLSALDDLVAAITPENLHGDLSTGVAVGNEVW